MSNVFDVVVAKEFTVNQNGKEEKKKQWNKVGRAWLSKSGEAINLELFMLPNTMMTVFMKEQSKKAETTENKAEASV